MEYPEPHQGAVVPLSETVEPETTWELAQLTVLAWHEVPLCPMPSTFGTDPAGPHHGVSASDDLNARLGPKLSWND